MQLWSGSVLDLKEYLGDKECLICFGAGKVLKSFFANHCRFDLVKNLRFIIDNNSKLWGTSIVILGKEIPIYSFAQGKKYILLEDMVLITARAFNEIYEQLQRDITLKEKRLSIYYDLEVKQYDVDYKKNIAPMNLRIADRIVIPKRIYYCWFGGHKIPAQYREWMGSWKKFCPDYDIIQIDESNYDVRKNQYISEAYDAQKWGFVSDYVRLDVIYQYGGLYFDTDVEIVRNFDELLYQDMFCGFESSRYVAFGLGFGAKAKHGLLQRIKKYYEDRSFIKSDRSFDETTCPVIQTKYLESIGLHRDGSYQRLDGLSVYPMKFFCGVNIRTMQEMPISAQSYSIHHFSGSWLDDNIKCKSEKIIADYQAFLVARNDMNIS